MIQFLFTLLVVASLGLLSGCNTISYVKMTPLAAPDQNIVFNEGKQTIISTKKHVVTLAPYRELNKASGRTSYVLFVQNLSDTPLTISDQNVFVELKVMKDGIESSSSTINVLSYNQMILEIQKEEERQRRAAAWAAAAGAINASTSAYSTSTSYNSGGVYGNYNSNTYGNYGGSSYNAYSTGTYSGTYSGYSTTTTYDPAKAQALANQNSQNYRNNLDRIAASANSSRQFVEQLVLRAQTLMPGDGVGGLIVTETRHLNHSIEGDFVVLVTVGDEKHEFLINRAYFAQ